MLCISAASAFMRCFLCLFVTFVYCVKMSNSNFSHIRTPTPFVFPQQTLWQSSDGDPPNKCVECRWGTKEIAIFDQYLASSRVISSVTVRCCKQSAAQLCVDCGWLTTKWHAFVNLVYDLDVTRKTAEQNLIVCTGKSEAVSNNKRLCSRYCTVEAD